MRVYLDNCCFNRPFDDQENMRVALETQAKLYIQDKIKEGQIQLVWSYILEFENGNNPHSETRALIADWKRLAIVDLDESSEILENAGECALLGLDQYDALHVACAMNAGCDYIITTDRDILKKMSLYKGMKIVNPIEFINLEVDS